MTNENEDIVTITDDNGETYDVKIVDIITVDDVEYVILENFDDNQDETDEYDEDEDSLVVMRLKRDGEEYSFEAIEDDDEFEKVSSYIESLEDEIDEEEI